MAKDKKKDKKTPSIWEDIATDISKYIATSGILGKTSENLKPSTERKRKKSK